MNAKLPKPLTPIVILVMAALAVIVIGVYSQTATTGTAGRCTSEVGTLKTQVTDLDRTNSNLQSILASQNGPSSNSTDLTAGSLFWSSGVPQTKQESKV